MFSAISILTDTFANNWADATQSVLLKPVQTWLGEHPLVAWLVMHPLWALALVVAGVLLLAGLWSAIARLTEGFWLTLVRLPFRLGAWIFAATSGVLVKRWVKSPRAPSNADRLGEILDRLDALQIEQEMLLAEMKQLLAKGPTKLTE
ncbi:MAG: hypothetical protein HC922_08940 [Leptolyngbyaceae cyanobacterium SM2_3_12]|nr:hypothetical protein [Leptolyngbyaceae cyanobacterium SM2_3_12]